jgi:hypothetical protein
MEYVHLFDMTGRKVVAIDQLHSSEVKISRDALSNGMYMVKIGLNGKEIQESFYLNNFLFLFTNSNARLPGGHFFI